MSPNPAPLENLPHAPASDVKKLGWRGVMKAVRHSGRLVVTNHDEPEAVILSVEEYNAIQQALEQADDNESSALNTLRQRFDERLACLQADDAGERLRAIMDKPAKLRGKVKAGARY